MSGLAAPWWWTVVVQQVFVGLPVVVEHRLAGLCTPVILSGWTAI